MPRPRLEKMKKALVEANKKVELAGEVPELRKQVEELGTRN